MGSKESVPEPGLPEPWLRGPLTDAHPLVMPVFFSFIQVREDLIRYTAGISEEHVWQNVNGASLGFHLKHIAGSVDRLTTYLAGESLTKTQLEFLVSESQADLGLDALLAQIDHQLGEAENRLRRLDPSALYAPRSVGRRALPTTVIGLLIHLAEHTQRHLGQAIMLARMLK